MITWETYILAKCPLTDELLRFNPELPIKAPTKELALLYAQNNGLGYLHIGDPLSFSVDYYTGEKIDFEHYLN